VRFLVDQDVWKVTSDLLRAWEHDVISAREIGMARSSDQELLLRATKDKRLLITRDKGFGTLTFLGDFQSSGVILLRIKPENQDEVHGELKKVLETHDERELQESFCTIEPGRYRIRRIQLYDAL
jgi:predicted nuclease of predicted toxin-antitoxin system